MKKPKTDIDGLTTEQILRVRIAMYNMYDYGFKRGVISGMGLGMALMAGMALLFMHPVF